jgi:hypothetical protein
MDGLKDTQLTRSLTTSPTVAIHDISRYDILNRYPLMARL